jgi:hypothetical protein
MSFLSSITKLDIWGAVEKIVQVILQQWQKVNKKVIGNVSFWLGLGLLIHDYAVEIDKNINPLRIHGGGIGISMIVLGLDFMSRDLEWNGLKIKAYAFGYGGLALAWLAWATRIFPGFIRHLFFWLGILCMGYSWYLLNQDDIGFIDKIKAQTIVESFLPK